METKISDSEWEIMRMIWRRHPITSNEIIELLDNKNWKENTIKTFLNRLLNKGIISFEKQGKTYFYSPVVEEKECIRDENNSFLKRVYGGAVSNLFAQFIEDQELTEDEIDALKNILDQKKKP